jgi:IS1 family transposase
MNQLPIEVRVRILRALCEGCSLRSTSRMVGVSINTVTSLLVKAGCACAKYQHDVMRDLPCKSLQLDEIWAFVAAKERNVPTMKKPVSGAGSVWTWVALCSTTKIVPSWLVGSRDGVTASRFVCDLASRLKNRVQVTTDGLRCYAQAMEDGFGGEVDHAILIKVYGDEARDEARYSPPECIGCQKHIGTGSPILEAASTSHVERQNLTIRMRNRRLTRLTNAFSKKLENHAHATALYFFAYNFIFRHQTLRMPPALKAGVAKDVWSYEQLVELVDRGGEL